MEFGHGIFYSRAEAANDFLQQMAHENRYIITAMDWRGMSAFDLFTMAKTLLSTPELFQSIRDNLIQGYAAKYALQEFSRACLWSMEWFSFGREVVKEDIMALTETTAYVFYGISQGGILGAGYSTLSGPTGLIDRGILSVPGTPFALILSRSLDFQGYDALLLLNFYNNRHVRIYLSLVQMAWDSVEGSGALAPPIRESFPRILLQAGLGDAVVSTVAAESLARAFGASTLPGNPRKVFGVPVNLPSNATWAGPNVTLTELLYEKDLMSLPADDVFPRGNSVHFCVRKDAALINQLCEFINTGRVVDPCAEDGCRRPRAMC